MKKYMLSLLTILFYLLCAFTPLPVQSSKADGTASYACVLEENTFFYTARDEKQGLFLLPKTYFVKVLETAPDFCKVEYLYDTAELKKVVGYAKTAQLTFVDYTPSVPYLEHLFQVDYLLDSDDTDNAFHKITVTCAYYGDYKIGSKTYCYVLRGDEFGYIPKPDTLDYPQSTEYADRLTPIETTDEPQTEEPTSKTSPALIAILIALCLLVPILSALVLKPPKRPPYDTDD